MITLRALALAALGAGYAAGASAQERAPAPAAPAAAEKAHHAPASPGLGDRVFSPTVVARELELGLRAARLAGGSHDKDAALVVEAGYGFTDRLYGAVLADFGSEHGGDFDTEAFAVEGVYEIGRLAGAVNMGVYGEYAALRDSDDAVAFKALFGHQTGGFDGRLNLGLHHSLGDDDHTAYGYGASTAWRVAPSFDLGLQAFGELGDNDGFGGRREHYVGPTAGFNIASLPQGAALAFETGYLFALGEAKDHADGQLRFLLTFKRHLGGHHAPSHGPAHGPAPAHGGGSHH